mmetsp:Transcript_32750/g.49359  ORF Transcript_32750/g.49359 Transcript_32750/m.49359 type:complete len:946 (-) Transcript_32750:203-3040(-)|eukprot:CAMPEP_0178896690 /NCGR_PEP_ID=MMETSP0786-20121207/1320_1 /TAXON_ID=186022 /ORGANISM="Thalassionema frauenfeldii, Strain CCMP 1798" /LENGTH=945 /DNA_ID=CAMNT_0020567135 /DNA_START=56 /DNA_END=2893 /DNA_ORIENTATION=-
MKKFAVGALRQSSFTSTRRYNATLQQVEVEAALPVPTFESPDFGKAVDKSQHQFSRSVPPRWRFDKAASVVLNEVKPGEMDYATLGQAKKLVLQACEYERPELATKLLHRLVNECRTNPNGYVMYQSVFNVTMSAWAKQREPEQAENVFAQMLNGHAENPSLFPPPDIYSYNALLAAWAGSNHPIAIDRVVEILEEMEGSEYQQPDGFTYNTVMTAYANLIGEYGAAKAAEDILLRFSERHVNGLLDEGPQTMSFNIAMKAWSNSGDEKGADRAHEIFRLMQKLTSEGHANVKPDEISLVSLIKAYGLKGDLDMVEKLLDTPPSEVDGDLKNCFNCAMSAYVMSGLKDAGEHAERIMERMEKPNKISYKTVMEAYAKGNHRNAAIDCENFLGKAVEKYLKYEIDVSPTKELFHIALRAWSEHQNKREAAERVSAIIEDMEGLRKEWNLHTTPDAKTYSYLIEIWSQIDVDKAEEILLKAEEQGINIWIRNYNMIIRGHAGQNSKKSIEKALQLLKILEGREQAKTFTYNLVLKGLAKLGSVNSARKCMNILNSMEEAARDGDIEKRPNMQTYTCVLNAMSGAASEGSRDTASAIDIFHRMSKLDKNPDSTSKLDLVGYSAILLLLSRLRSVEAANTATEIIKQMLDPTTGVNPDAGCMSSAVLANARARSIRHIYVAHDMLVYLSRLFLDGKLQQYPHPSSFTTVLNAWSLSQESSSVKRGFELLTLMKDLNDAGVESIPNKVGYNAFFSVMAKSKLNNGGFEAEKILRTIPNASTDLWNSVLQVWAYSKHTRKAFEAQRCLRDMQAAGIQANNVSFNSVLNAAAHSHVHSDEFKDESMEIAMGMFEELCNCEYAEPDHVTYGCLMKCFRNLTEASPDRDNSILDILERCKQEGKVGSMCIREIHATLTPTDFEKCIGFRADAFSTKPASVLGSLPMAWTINAKN